MELSKIQRFYLQTIFDYFHEKGTWPTYGYIERVISKTHRDFDMREVARSLPSGFASAFAFNIDRNQEAILIVPAVHMCKGSEGDLADFVRLLQFCVNKYFSFVEDNLKVDSDDLKEQLKLSELSIRKVGRLIEAEAGFWMSFGRKDNEGNSWVCSLAPGMDGIARFDGVKSIDEYLEKQDEQRKHSSIKSFTGRINIVNPSPTIEKVAKADPSNIQEIAASLLELGNSYYINMLRQSQQSFLWACIWAGVGTLFFITTVILFIIQQPTNLSYISATITAFSGAVVEVIAGINFNLYGRASDQADAYHVRLDRIQRFLVANSACESLEGNIKQSTRAELIMMLVNLQRTNGEGRTS